MKHLTPTQMANIETFKRYSVDQKVSLYTITDWEDRVKSCLELGTIVGFGYNTMKEMLLVIEVVTHVENPNKDIRILHPGNCMTKITVLE